jgi:hypothetical protein
LAASGTFCGGILPVSSVSPHLKMILLVPPFEGRPLKGGGHHF